MIRVTLPAKMECIEPNCGTSVAVELFLLATGGFGFKPPSDKWQVGTPRQQPGGPYMCRCPKHAQTVQVIPAIPSKVIVDAH